MRSTLPPPTTWFQQSADRGGAGVGGGMFFPQHDAARMKPADTVMPTADELGGSKKVVDFQKIAAEIEANMEALQQGTHGNTIAQWGTPRHL